MGDERIIITGEHPNTRLEELEHLLGGDKTPNYKEEAMQIARILCQNLGTPQQKKIRELTPQQIFDEIKKIDAKVSKYSAKERKLIQARHFELCKQRH